MCAEFIFRAHGLQGLIADVIIVEREAKDRATKVAQWCALARPQSWVHIDDSPVGGPYHIQPRSDKGLIPKHATEAIKLLNKT